MLGAFGMSNFAHKDASHLPDQPDQIAADLTQAQRRLGERIAYLKAPNIVRVKVGSMSETDGSDDPNTAADDQWPPVEIYVRHYLEDRNSVVVATRTDRTGGVSMVHQIWSALVNFQFVMMSVRGGSPWSPGPVPAELEHLIDMNNPPEMTQRFALRVDGVSAAWDQITCPDLVTGEPVMAAGGRIGKTVITVAGPLHIVDNLSLGLWAGSRD